MPLCTQARRTIREVSVGLIDTWRQEHAAPPQHDSNIAQGDDATADVVLTRDRTDKALMTSAGATNCTKPAKPAGLGVAPGGFLGLMLKATHKGSGTSLTDNEVRCAYVCMCVYYCMCVYPPCSATCIPASDIAEANGIKGAAEVDPASFPARHHCAQIIAQANTFTLAVRQDMRQQHCAFGSDNAALLHPSQPPDLTDSVLADGRCGGPSLLPACMV